MIVNTNILKNKKLTALLFILVFSFVPTFSADLSFLSGPLDNNITFGTEKLSGTYLFFNRANYGYNSEFGLFNLKQNYTGAANNSGGNSFRDDETLSLDYLYNLTGKLQILSESKMMISTDSRSLGINDLQKLNSVIGLKYNFDPESFLAIKLGPESNKQSFVKTGGYLGLIQAKTKEYEFDGYKLKSYATGEILNLNDGRKNTDIEFYVRMGKGFDEYNLLDLDGRLKLQDKDFLAQSSPGIVNNPILNRKQSSFGASLNTAVSISNYLRSMFVLAFDKMDIERSYSTIIEGNDFSKSYRKQTDLNLLLSSEAEINLNKFRQNFGLSYIIRSSDNTLTPKFSIPEADLNLLRNSEQLNNNSAGTTRFFSKTYWNFTKFDTLNANYSISLMQFDTPGKDNNDDRDELNIYVEANYGKRISPFLKGFLKFEGKSSHIVYLKSQRSSANNKNKYIKLSPGFQYSSEGFSINPTFEILANYTVYDYEKINPNLAGASFRQISYKDSISLKLLDDYFVTANVFYRYFEIGKLIWDDFAENPQTNSYELFSKLSLNTFVGKNGIISPGFRYNQLKANKNIILGPEISYQMKFSEGSFVTIIGWYEFRYFNYVFLNSVLNLYVSTSIKL